jgi:hypothetical protein
MLVFCAGVGLTLAAQAFVDQLMHEENAWVQISTTGNKTAHGNLLAHEFT